MTERTDRELLELAAKAAGEWPESWHDSEAYFTGVLSRWNPLEDDGDAFRLMVALGIRPEFDGYAELAMQDELYKTRRAIVRAAAAMAEGGDHG
ncbi:hypothetical protein [Pseudomonas sp.]|uniref:hypothetical protein n=1 Tax=Pseudomonas sp. TaxID=306 RepID=UPI003242A73E